MWIQKNIQLSAKTRGFHLITDQIISELPELQALQIGLLHVFIKHTSASLTMDDMPAHLKSSILGNNLTIPITSGKLNMGTWQGIYLGEHRNHAGSRNIILTLYGE